MMSLVTQNRAGGTREAITREISPSTTTVRPDSHTKRRTAGTLRSAASRSRHPPRKSGPPVITESYTRLPEGIPSGTRNASTQASVELSVTRRAAESISGKQNWLSEAIKRGLDEKAALTVGPMTRPREQQSYALTPSIYGNLLVPFHPALPRSS